MKTPNLYASDGECWVDGGEGAVVFLIHGIGGTTASWSRVTEALSLNNRVIAWTFPGYECAAPLASAVPTPAAYAARALRLLERLSVSSAWILGHSLGAVVATEIVRLAPKRVDGLTLLCPVTGFGALAPEERETIHTERVREIHAGGMHTFAAARARSIAGSQIDPCALEEIVATMAAIPADAYLSAWRMLCDANILARLDGYGGPASVIGCEHDPVAPIDSVNAVAGVLGVQPHIMPGIGHFPMHEATEALLPLLRPSGSRV